MKGFCSVDGCERSRQKRTWCNMHYQRWCRHGDPGGAEPLRKAGPCRLEGCARRRHCRDLCSKHYFRLFKTGTTELPACDACAAQCCDTHRPTVCVCDVPKQGPVTGQCDRCFRPYWVQSPELQAVLPEVREAWRKFLADEGVYDLHVATEVAA